MKSLFHATLFLVLSLTSHGGYLGLSLDIVDKGAKVVDLVKGGPAAKAGLENGDILLQIDGKKTRKQDMPGIVRGILMADAGASLGVVFQRGGKRREAEIILAERPVAVPPDKPPGPVVPVKPRNKWLGKKLPAFTLDDWHQLPAGKDAIRRQDLEGKVACVFAFNVNDAETLSWAMALFRTIALDMKGRPNALPVAIHIGDKDSGKDSARAAIRELRKHNLHFVPMAQVIREDDEPTAIEEALDLLSIPYFMIVDSTGEVKLAEKSTHPVVAFFLLQELGV